jgi:protein-tyrosine phosphatase
LRDVPDPYYSDDALFDAVLGMIERANSALFAQLAPAIRQGVR